MGMYLRGWGAAFLDMAEEAYITFAMKYVQKLSFPNRHLIKETATITQD